MMTNVWSSVKSNRLHIEASIIGIAFVLVGIYHFIDQDFFEAIVPTWFRYATFANLASGGAEIVLGLMLIVPKFRRVGAWGLLVLLVAVYPANIDMFINDVDVQTNASGVAERIVDAEGVRLRNFIRLPFQFFCMVGVAAHQKATYQYFRLLGVNSYNDPTA